MDSTNKNFTPANAEEIKFFTLIDAPNGYGPRAEQLLNALLEAEQHDTIIEWRGSALYTFLSKGGYGETSPLVGKGHAINTQSTDPRDHEDLPVLYWLASAAYITTDSVPVREGLERTEYVLLSFTEKALKLFGMKEDQVAPGICLSE